jgi:hypothetical protein
MDDGRMEGRVGLRPFHLASLFLIEKKHLDFVACTKHTRIRPRPPPRPGGVSGPPLARARAPARARVSARVRAFAYARHAPPGSGTDDGRAFLTHSPYQGTMGWPLPAYRYSKFNV